MIHSMTGYGKAEGVISNKKVTVQIKSLNSKLADISTKVPNLFRELDITFRKELGSQMSRGKIELSIYYENLEQESNFEINTGLLKQYYQALKSVEIELGADSNNLLEVVSKFPDVLKNRSEELNEEEKLAILALFEEAIKNAMQFREDEGKTLAKDLSFHVNKINSLLTDALQYEDERISTVKERLKSNLEELGLKSEINQDRFEQELIYYMEKYDISEEKVRLATHCNYFLSTMEEEQGQGKKLGFISQEMGREINTLGSKSNHALMQKIVVEMKDELEKIKEQILNVL